MWIYFAIHAGFDVEKLVATIGKGAAKSGQMNNRATTMSHDELEFGFAAEWMRKDHLGICMAEAERNGARLPMTEVVDGLLCAHRRAMRQALGHQQPGTPSRPPG